LLLKDGLKRAAAAAEGLSLRIFCGMLQLPRTLSLLPLSRQDSTEQQLGLLAVLFGKVGRASKPTQSAFEYSLATSVSARSSFISIHSKNGNQLRQQLLRPHLGDHPYVLPRLLRKNLHQKRWNWRGKRGISTILALEETWNRQLQTF
jgi:hypothetical protein